MPPLHVQGFAPEFPVDGKIIILTKCFSFQIDISCGPQQNHSIKEVYIESGIIFTIRLSVGLFFLMHKEDAV